MTNLSLRDLGVRPSKHGIRPADHWVVTFSGCPGASGMPFLLFDEEPEHRAIETLMERFGADSARIDPPVRS
jgi:hypothetical protein